MAPTRAAVLSLLSLAFSSALLAACGDAKDRADGPKLRSVRILVAASAQDAVRDVAKRLGAARGLELVVVAGASNQLAQQILNGVPADLFLSANAQWAREVGKAGRAQESRNLLGNRVVLVVPKGIAAPIRSLDDLRAPKGRTVVLAGEKVPAGIYGEAALRARGLYDVLARDGEIVRAQDVRSALTFVERREADAGVVFATDARMSPGVEVVHVFDPADHDPIVYPLVLLKDAPAGEAARAAFEMLASAPALEVFREHGFEAGP